MENGLAALRELEEFAVDRANQRFKTAPTERHALDIVKKDAIYAVLQHAEAQLYAEYDRLKLVELEHLYQVRGLRQVMPSAIFREGYAGYGNSWTGSKIRLLYPQDRKRAGRESREPFLPINKIHETKDLSEQLVPLRIDLATDKYRLKDRILWNADDTTVPLELFVEITLEDYGLPLSLASEVSRSLQEQISFHLPHLYPSPADLPKEQSADIEMKDAEPNAEPNADSKEGDEPKEGESKKGDKPIVTFLLNQEAEYDEDMRFTIKLDIAIGQHVLIDQFEWDINNPENDPEMFGLVLCNELALPLEFSTAISHSIREQVQAYTKQLFNSGYQFDGKPPHDQQLQNEISLPVGEHQFLRRPELLAAYTPALHDAKISGLDQSAHEQDVERREIRSRRRLGRSSRRGHHHEGRPGMTPNAAVTFMPRDVRAPLFCTPVFSSVLPGGLDRNLAILYMTIYRNDDGYGGDKQDLVYYFHKHRREQQVPSISQFEPSMAVRTGPNWIVKLKIPKTK